MSTNDVVIAATIIIVLVVWVACIFGAYGVSGPTNAPSLHIGERF
jgi:hypothetical protein